MSARRVDWSIDEREPNEAGGESDPGSFGRRGHVAAFQPANGLGAPSVRLPAFTGSLAAHREGGNRGRGKLVLLVISAGCARTDIAAGTADAGLPRGLGSNSSRTISLPKDAFKNGKGGPRGDSQHVTVKASIVPK